MKTTIIYILLFAAFLSTTLQAATTYKTIASGDWNDPTIWSTGGPNACHCVPGDVVDNNNVVVNHYLLLTADVEFINRAKLTVNAAGSLVNTSYGITLTNGDIVSDGYIEVASLFVDINSKAVFNADLYLLHGLTNDGLIHLDATLIIEDGDILNRASGRIIALRNSHVSIQKGNVLNFGLLNMHDACMELMDGDFINDGGGVANGPGGISVYDGTVVNQSGGTWANAVNWCAGGQGIGMPVAEDCGHECAAGQLPVELIGFEANTVETGVEISWTTATEENNNHFVLEKSTDGTNFTAIATVGGQLNSSAVHAYSYVDTKTNASGLIYYRLVQVDVDGAEDIYGPVTVVVQPIRSTNVYPNPATDVLNVEFDGPSVDWKLMAMTGAVFSEGNNSTGLFQLDLSSLPTGTYQLILLSATGVVTEKVIKY